MEQQFEPVPNNVVLQTPGEIDQMKMFFLISAIINILGFLGWGFNTFISGVFTCGLGCVIGFLPVLNIVSCVMDFIAYNKLSNLNQSGTYSTVNNAAIMQIVTIVTGNIVSLIFGIVTLNNLKNENVQNFLRFKNIY